GPSALPASAKAYLTLAVRTQQHLGATGSVPKERRRPTLCPGGLPLADHQAFTVGIGGFPPNRGAIQFRVSMTSLARAYSAAFLNCSCAVAITSASNSAIDSAESGTDLRCRSPCF